MANLIPGTSYNALLVAKNVDGTTSVGPIPFTTTPGCELIAVIINVACIFMARG